MSRIAVVGAGSGVGRYLVARFGAVSFMRGDSFSKLDGCDSIVFCAAKARFHTPTEEVFAAVRDNLLLLDQVSQLPHKRFVYFSSVDVYPKDEAGCRENMPLALEMIPSGYAAFKYMSEAIVKERSDNALILRPTSLFGPGMRPNNIVRMFRGDSERLSLCAESLFNCVTYSMIADLIEAAWECGSMGVVNCAANRNASLAEVAQLCDFKGQFGEHLYQVADVRNDLAQELNSDFAKSTLDILREHFRV